MTWRRTIRLAGVAVLAGALTAIVAGGSPATAGSTAGGHWPMASPTTSAATPAAARTLPLFAYYYIWFSPSSWGRAKRDLPLIGAYSSSNQGVMREQIQQAKAAGING